MPAPVLDVVFAIAAIASVYRVAEWLAAGRFFRRSHRAAVHWAARRYAPPVTVLKPLKGPGIDLYENLASFCRQDYPRYQVVFGVADPDDPAVEVVTQLRRDFPHVDIALSIGDEPGANRKVANLLHMMRHARHAVLVMSDGDIRVRRDYLRTMVAPLADPHVGLTTCLYRGVGHFGLPSVAESLLINTDFIPMVMMAQWVQEFRYAYGASIAFKREALDRVGGFAPIADHLADDYELGRRVHEAGYRLVLLPYVVETVLDSVTLRDVWRHQLRWQRTYRVCQPFNWFASVVTHTTLWGVLAVLASGGAAAGWGMLGAALACRLGAVAGTMRLLGDRETLRHLWLVPAKDLAFSAIWTSCWFGRTVQWSGQTLYVDRDGRMRPVGPAVPQPASVAARPVRRAQGGVDARL